MWSGKRVGVRYRNLDRPMIEVTVAPSPLSGRREPYGPAEAPRQDVGHAQCLVCLDFLTRPLYPGEQYLQW